MEIGETVEFIRHSKNISIKQVVVIISLGKPIIVLLKIILTFLRKSYFIS
ncbi:transcriptional activator, Rgg/GadR/MutR family, domain-containing protein [Streptococcus pyogenes]|nr:transcriptional activator, Rgg/GadR/MutR family, domain-containing protein [Streptococcus pyogenes]